MEPKHRINTWIKAKEVRLVGDNIPKPDVYPIEEALRMGDEMDLDLVEISSKSDPPVCKLIDYDKYIYQEKKKQKASKSKASKLTTKEIRFGPHTEEHDYNFKLKHAQKFLNEGSKVKAYVFFKGRSIVHKDSGEILLLRFAQDLQDISKVEQMPKLEGKRMILFLAPKSVKK